MQRLRYFCNCTRIWNFIRYYYCYSWRKTTV